MHPAAIGEAGAGASPETTRQLTIRQRARYAGLYGLAQRAASAVTARIRDIDLAARQSLKLVEPTSFLDVMAGTKLEVHTVPGLSSEPGSSSVKLAGADGLRGDVLTPGRRTAQLVDLSALRWMAQTIAHFDYLLNGTREAAVLAGSHGIPVRLCACNGCFPSHPSTKGGSRNASTGLNTDTVCDW